MNRILSTLLTMFVVTFAIANPVTPEQARNEVARFLSGSSRRSMPRNVEALRLVSTSYFQLQSEQLAPCYYVFNNGTDEGYVIAAADDRMPCVLGYADSGTFQADNLPENMQAWLGEYERQMEWLAAHPNDAAAPRQTVQGSAISPLLGQIEWNQGAPYNNFCPTSQGKNGVERCVTGCVATAMAQIMYYHQWPTGKTKGIPGYTTEELGLVIDSIPPTTINWANIQPKYPDAGSGQTQAQRDAVAQLMQLCGTALKMDYNLSENGGSSAATSMVAYALRTYFNYDDGTRYLDRSDYRQAAWNQLIYDELAAGRPVSYSGASSGGGHEFVIDGYDKDDFFHVNWGWGGSSNGYFLLSILDPGSNDGIGASSSSDGYSFRQEAVVGIQKSDGIPYQELVALSTYSISVTGESNLTRSSKSKDFNTRLAAEMRCYTQKVYTFNYGYGLFDSNDNFVAVASNTYDYTPTDVGWGYSARELDVRFGANIPNGTYRLKPISRKAGTSTWHANFGTDIYYVTAIINGNTATLQEPVVSLSGSLVTTGKTEAYSLMPMKATIKNNGTLINTEIFLLVDGEMVGGRYFEAEPGQTQTVQLSYKPEEAGTKTVSLALRKWNSDTKVYDYSPFITQTIDISPATAADLKITYNLPNATNNVVNDPYIQLKLGITNNGPTSYENTIRARIYQYEYGHPGSDTYWSIRNLHQDISLEQGKKTTIDFVFDNLEDDKYLIVVYYLSEGEWVQGLKTRSITVDTQGGEEAPIVVTVNNASRSYGEQNPLFTYSVSGGTLTGEPSISCSASATSPVGVYDIVASKGSITNANVTFVKGTLTVTKAPLTVKAQDATMTQGDALPSFKINYQGFKNGETESVLTRKPQATTTATPQSSPGTYPINVSGGEAQNYSFSYVPGTLTVTAIIPDGTNIVFADQLVKEICTDKWDANGDGELSRQEAAAVTDLGITFMLEDIEYFEELKYFTGLNEIGDLSFLGCEKLKSVTIPANVTTINALAFELCSSLPSVYIPENVNTIEEGAFAYCESLALVVLQKGVEKISSMAFLGCPSLNKVITYNPYPIAIDDYVFSLSDEEVVYPHATLFVPRGSKTKYLVANGWKNFYAIQELSEEAIPTVKLDADGDNCWYTLDGRKLQGKPTTRGIYLQNGRKILLK